MTMNSLPMRAMRTDPVGLSRGMCETCLVGGQHDSHDLHFPQVAGGEQRADGAVDQPRGEDLLGGGTTLALDEAAGELARGVGLLAVIDDEGEEIAPLLGIPLDGGHQRHGVAQADEHGAVGLLGQSSRFDTQRLGAQRTFNTTCRHGTFLIWCGPVTL
jgi:hypothetical protein